MKIEVVVPPWKYWHDPIKLQPLWELYYATLFAERLPSVQVKMTDLRERTDDPIPNLQDRDVFFYWIMKSADAYEVYDWVKRVRASGSKALHIAGGTHIDHCIVEAQTIFDSCVVGTGEEPMIQAFTAMQTGQKPAPVLRSEGVYPFANYSRPKREFLPDDRIANHKHFEKYGGVLATGVYFSRGCSFRCNFCVYNNPGKIQIRTPEQVDEELSYLVERYGVKGVNLRDEVCLPLKKEDALRQMEVMGKHNLIWRGQTVPFGPEEVVIAAKQSGCVELALGLESVESDDVLKLINKPSQSVRRHLEYIHCLKKHGIRVKVCLIFGLPGETKNVLKNTIQFLDEAQPDFVALSGFDPVPGSSFFKEAEKYGIKNISTDLSKHAHLMFRFGNDESVGLPFEYDDVTSWGVPLKRSEIVENMQKLQEYLRTKGMVY